MYTPFVIYMAICVVAIALATSHKARCLFMAVVLAAVVFAGVLSLHGAARAEEIPDIKILYSGSYKVKAVIADGEVVTKITFAFGEDDLSLYWEGELDTGRDIWVSICGSEVINGGYVVEE